MKYSMTVERDDGTQYGMTIESAAGDKEATAMARNMAESYGHRLIGLADNDGKEITVANDDQNKDTEERIEEQDKTTTERVDTQKVETKEVSPDKTGDVKPNR